MDCYRRGGAQLCCSRRQPRRGYPECDTLSRAAGAAERPAVSPLNTPRREGVRINIMSDFSVEIERETDGRWIGEVPDLPGVMVYATSRDEAVAKAKALAFRVLADRLEHGEDIPELRHVFAVNE